MKTKKNYAKVMSLIMVVAMLIGCVGSTTVYAAGNDYFAYAENHEIGGFTFTDTNTTPVKTVARDERVHHMILRIHYRIAEDDQGTGPIRLLVYVVRPGVPGKELIFSGVTNSKTTFENDQSLWFNVSYGEKVQFFFDAQTDGGASSGPYRKCEIVNWWGYCD